MKSIQSLLLPVEVRPELEHSVRLYMPEGNALHKLSAYDVRISHVSTLSAYDVRISHVSTYQRIKERRRKTSKEE